MSAPVRAATGLAVRCVGLSHEYRVGARVSPVLDSVDFDVAAGASLAVLGPSGSGKSTLLVLIAGLQPATAGQIFVGDRDVTRLSQPERVALRARRIGVVMQNPAQNLLPYGTAQDNIRFAQRPVPRAERAALPRPDVLLGELGLADFADRPVGRLSGGEQQRLAVAVGLARAPGLLLVDEPTNHLDSVNRDRVIALLQAIPARFGTTVIAVTHDQVVAAALDRTVQIANGRIVEQTR